MNDGEFAMNLLKARSWERANLPFGNSSAAVDVALLSIHYEANGHEPSVKDFHFVLQYSEFHVGTTIQSLVADGWLSSEPLQSDARRRCIRPTGALTEWFAQYRGKLAEFFRSLDPHGTPTETGQ